MAGRKKLDPVSEAAIEVVEMERQQAELARQEREERECRIAECHEVIGRIQGFNIVGKLTTVGTLVWLKEVKESKLYRDLPNIGTWENFCNYLGFSRQKVDEDLTNLQTFGEEFLTTVGSFSLGYRELRRLRQLTHEGALQVEDGVLVIGDEEIPLDADHREDLQAAMERLLDAKEQLLAEKDANLRTKERLLQDKQKLIERQAKDLARYEGEAERKGLLPAEDAFIQKCNNARITIDGFFLQFDPERNPLPEDSTPRMKAALMETLRYFKRVVDAAYDTTGDYYGDAEMDSPGWVQPNLREAEESLGASLAAAREKRR